MEDIESNTRPGDSSAGAPSLDTVLGHCTLVKAMIEESLQELSLVNRETRLHEACQVLAAASRVLADEIKERRMLDHQYAAIQEQEATGRHRILHDALTGLPNRILFHDRLEHGLAQSLRHGRPLAVMFIDLDGFKEVNDQYGHDMGDAILQVLATRLKEHTRGEDTASRYGGDEFLYLLADPGNHDSIVTIAERMICLIQEPCNVGSPGAEISVSLGASIGISISPKNGVTVDQLVKSADSAMYCAKERRSGYSFAF